MRLGYFLPQMGPAAGPDAIVAVARRVEEIGYDSVWVTERVLNPLDPSVPYPATPDGSLPDVYQNVIDPLSTLAFVAGQTSRVALGTSVLNLPWYNPVLLARSLTAIDVLSKGRLRVGLGMGWSTDEYESVGVEWRGRGRRADETLDALKAIWTSDPVEFEGEHLRIRPSIIGPKPVQKPHPPIYMAAYTPAAMARVARYADGWMPVGVPLEGMAAMLSEIRSMAKDAGRDPDALALIVRANLSVTHPHRLRSLHLHRHPGADRRGRRREPRGRCLRAALRHHLRSGRTDRRGLPQPGRRPLDGRAGLLTRTAPA